jgi:hypothetical protein
LRFYVFVEAAVARGDVAGYGVVGGGRWSAGFDGGAAGIVFAGCRLCMVCIVAATAAGVEMHVGVVVGAGCVFYTVGIKYVLSFYSQTRASFKDYLDSNTC